MVQVHTCMLAEINVLQVVLGGVTIFSTQTYEWELPPSPPGPISTLAFNLSPFSNPYKEIKEASAEEREATW